MLRRLSLYITPPACSPPAHVSQNHDGTLSLDEFLSAIRRDMHVSPAEVSEKDLRYLFSTLDSDGGGAVEIGELVDSFQIKTQGVTTRKAKSVRHQTLADFSAADTIKTMTWRSTRVAPI